MGQSLRRIAEQHQRIYERNAALFDGVRRKNLFEKVWLDRFLALLQSPAKILDVGCGAGEPIAKYFIDQGHAVTGIDFSQSMLAIPRGRFPSSRWLLADMRDFNLEETFDGIVGWHSFFHLTPNERRTALKLFAAHLAPKGALLLTVGGTQSEVVGHVGDDEVYQSSFAPKGYEGILSDLGMKIVRFAVDDPECDKCSVLLAQKV